MEIKEFQEKGIELLRQQFAEAGITLDENFKIIYDLKFENGKFYVHNIQVIAPFPKEKLDASTLNQ